MIEQADNLVGKIYVAGTRGYSNYEIAVKNGFEGTEEEWLQSMFDYAADITKTAVTHEVSQKIEDGTYNIAFETIYSVATEDLVLQLAVINSEESE